MPIKKSAASNELEILVVDRGQIDFYIVGTAPLYFNRMSEKAMRQLLSPPPKKTAADKASSPKHDMLAEFRASAYTDDSGDGPTHLQALCAWFKGATKNAALDMPGINKTQIGRLLWVVGGSSEEQAEYPILRERTPLYGVPQLGVDVTRSADMNRTPDVRTRCVVPEWCCKITVEFVRPLLKEIGVANLVASAGITQGVGDWRIGKGSGTFGTYRIVAEDDPEWKRIAKMGGRKAQLAALERPTFRDRESRELYEWFQKEMDRRGFAATTAAKASRKLGAKRLSKAAINGR